ncbi:hypothetical protein U1Q18_013535 [Sarracenia purpurea var. burkii]
MSQNPWSPSPTILSSVSPARVSMRTNKKLKPVRRPGREGSEEANRERRIPADCKLGTRKIGNSDARKIGKSRLVFSEAWNQRAQWNHQLEIVALSQQGFGTLGENPLWLLLATSGIRIP